MKLDINLLLKNKIVLYVTLFLSITNIFGYLMSSHFDAVIFFFIVGFLVTYFSKNMIVIMLIAMFTTNFLFGAKMVGIKMFGSYKEGLENKDTKPQMTGAKPLIPSSSVAKPSMAAMSSTPMVKPMNSKPMKKKQQDAMSNLHGSSIDGLDDDYDDLSKPKINYASTLESAYDNLDKLLSSDSINKMTADTQRLAEKQQLLMGNIEKLVPFIGKAEHLLKGMNSDKMGGMLESMQQKMASISTMAQ